MAEKLKNSTTFVYTLSSRGHMVPLAIKSIRTLKQWTDPESIQVFYTPPHKPEHEKALRELDIDLKKKSENYTESFQAGSDPAKHYGEKLRLCNVETENVVFLDCDTLVLGNIWEVVEGDFEFKARITNYVGNTKTWSELMEEIGSEIEPKSPNTGFLVFKKNSHKKIQNIWEKIFRETTYIVNGNNFKDQYSLAIASAELDRREMTEDEHVLEFGDEISAKGIVYHTRGGKGPGIPQRLLDALNRNLSLPVKKYFYKIHPNKTWKKIESSENFNLK